MRYTFQWASPSIINGFNDKGEQVITLSLDDIPPTDSNDEDENKLLLTI